MSKAIVNMTPNPLDIQTIHCSQGDTEAREWGFELHNNGEKIDSSSISDQMVFKAYKGGTEQILPENGSTPTTSPFKGDIKYPQGLLSDQEFLYRESPTEEDGLAWITDIKGNTLVWNQLVQNGNFADTSGWRVPSQSVSLTASNNSLVIHQDAGGSNSFIQYLFGDYSWIENHKYLICVDTVITNGYIVLVPTNTGSQGSKTQTTSGRLSMIWNAVQTTVKNCSFQLRVVSGSAIDITLRNFNIYDLTAMFDTSKADEIYAMEQSQSGSGVSYFRSLFSLPYYDFNQGTLIPFSGNGIKTTGKNLLSYNGENLPYNANGVSITREDNIYKVVASNPSGYPFARISTIHYLPKGQYTVTMLGAESSDTGIAWRLIDRNVSPVRIFVNASATNTTFTLNEDLYDVYFEITIDVNKLSAGAWDVRFQLNMGTPSDYEPYTSTTTDLPISTYFPTGMKSAGNAYDELTESKAITRVGMVDLGTLNWYYTSGGQGRFATGGISSTVKPVTSNTEVANIKNAKYSTISAGLVYNGNTGIAIDNAGAIWVYDTTYGTDASAFRTAMNGVYLYYELATPTETSFTTASIVTENAEIPLSNEDGTLIGKCTEQLSSESGFIDAKIKLADTDGECYSNKIQLHVERSPQ